MGEKLDGDELCGCVINETYKLIANYAKGTFGRVYVAIDLTTKKTYAVKVEHVKTKFPQLTHEAEIYKALGSNQGVPAIRWFGRMNDYLFLIMDFLGPSLESLYQYCSYRFTLKTVLMLADQMISRIQFVHSKGFLHRDIKPENFLVGQGQNYKRIYLIDFGLAKAFCDPVTKVHIPYKEGRPLAGTARFASTHQLMGHEHSRRDDLISIGYVLMYFNRGSLPWQGLKAASRQQKFEKICEKKLNTPIDVLCRNYPAEFSMYLHYCMNLQFDETPDYDYLRQLFCILMRMCNHHMDYNYDWHFIRKPWPVQNTLQSNNNNESQPGAATSRLPPLRATGSKSVK